MNTPKRPVALMTVAQAICAIATVFTLLTALSSFSLVPNLFVMYQNKLIDAPLAMLLEVIYLLRDLAHSICFIFVEVEAFRICGRTKTSSAFSAQNVTSLGRIAKALDIAGLIALAMGDAIVPYLLTGLPAISPIVERLLLPFTLLTLSLMVGAVQVLMRRAVTMQEETDLTV